MTPNSPRPGNRPVRKRAGDRRWARITATAQDPSRAATTVIWVSRGELNNWEKAAAYIRDVAEIQLRTNETFEWLSNSLIGVVMDATCECVDDFDIYNLDRAADLAEVYGAFERTINKAEGKIK